MDKWFVGNRVLGGLKPGAWMYGTRATFSTNLEFDIIGLLSML